MPEDNQIKPQIANDQSTAILKELSDIKANLAVNSNETANIKASIGEIKIDIREIKNDYIARREFTDALIQVRKELAFFQRLVYSVFSVMGLAIAGALFKLILK